MNFYCSPLESSFPELIDLNTIKTKNGWYVSLDNGWDIRDDHAFKGINSSWCRIEFKEEFSITTNELRDFPIFYHDTCVTNILRHTPLLPTDGNVYWKDGKVQTTWNKDFYPEYDGSALTFDQSHKILFNILCESVELFATNNSMPIYIPMQGGLDSLTVRSVFDYLEVKYKFFDMPEQVPVQGKLQKKLKCNVWGFGQVREMDNSVIVTGFHGDEWILRNPYYAHVLLSQQGKSIVDEFDQVDQCYMKDYFNSNYKSKCSEKTTMTVHKLQTMMCNDYQIWHLNKTYFFSPLKHKGLLQLLNADSNTIIEQVTKASLSKSIIEKCNNQLLGKLDKVKNMNDPIYFPLDIDKNHNVIYNN